MNGCNGSNWVDSIKCDCADCFDLDIEYVIDMMIEMVT